MEKKEIYKKIFANLALVILALICAKFFLPYIISLFFPFILAYIIALIANPIVKFLEKKIKIKRKYSSFVIIAGVLSGIIAMIYYAGKTIVKFVMEIVNNVSVITDTITDITSKLQGLTTKYGIEQSNEIISSISASLSTFIENISTSIINYTGNVISNIPMFIIVFILTVLSAYFMLKDDFKIKINFLDKSPKFQKIKKEIFDVLKNYLVGQFKIMFIIFIILIIGFGLMKVEYFILIAFLIAFLDLLPVFGTGTVLYPWMAISLLYGDYKQTLYLFIIYATAFLARQLLQPKIISTSIGLDALPTLVLMFIGFKIWGLGGLIFAPPIGLVVIKIYKLGIFDNYKQCVIYLYKDLKEFLKIDFPQEVKNDKHQRTRSNTKRKN